MILATLLLLLQAGQTYTGPKNSKVEVDGSTYRVFVRGREVKVFNKSAITAIGGGRSVDRRDAMRQAVRQATGCEIKDDFWRNQVLAGELDCSSRPVE